MCGICGFTGKENDVALRGMADAIVHRGPDEDGFFSDGRVNLGMRRLSIIDLATGHQPVHNEDSSLWAVFNGELYNFQELRKDLEAKGHRFYTDHSDTECLVHLYEEYGRDFVHHINGMFSIALWDARSGTLLLVRDRMGVKPLFYAAVNGRLIFGSEIKAILRHPAYSRDVNHEAIYHYFSLKHIPAPFTAFQGIYSIMPGEMITFVHGVLSRSRWWKVRFNEQYNYREEEVKDQILKLLEDAVRLRMISDVPFGAYLSGGVDSSSVVAVMTKYSDRPVKTFALGYEDELKNKEADLHYARKVSKAFGTEHYEYIMSHGELTDEIGNVIRSFDQPFSGTISTYFLSKLIKKHVKVALSGDGADELFGSYLSHRVAGPMAHFTRLLPKVRSQSLSDEERALFAPCDIPYLQKLYDLSGGKEVDWRYHLLLFNDEEKRELLTDAFRSGSGSASTRALLGREYDNLTARDPLNRVLEMEWNSIFPDQVLAFVDFLSMAHSIEIRSPFLDYRLVEFTATIPGSMKIANGNVKDILKKGAERLLPPGITARPKEGFVLPIFDWMTEKLKPFCRDVLADRRIGKHGFFKREPVHSLLERYAAGDRACAGKIWNLMMFQIWWELYFSDRAP